MRKNKKSLIVTASVIAVIVIILVTLAILFFATDLLKSDKELFFKYLAKNEEKIQIYMQDPNSSLLDSIKQDKHTTKTDISFDLVSSDSTIANQTVPPRNFTIQYTAQADPQNNMDSSQATIKFLTKDLFNVKYAHNQDLYAVGSDEVVNVYLAVNNNQLKQLAQKMGYTDVSKVPNRIEQFKFSDLIQINEEDKQYIKDTYFKMIDSGIEKENYSSQKNVMIQIDTKEVKTNCYSLTLNSNEYATLLTSILNNLKQDDRTLNLILQKITMIDSQTDITLETLRNNINTKINEITNGTNDGITIRVYENDGELVRTEIEKENEDKYTFDFEQNNNSIRTIMNYEYSYFQQNSTTTNKQPIDNTVIDDGYMQIQGNENAVQNNVTTQEPTTQSESIKLKGVEIAKQIDGNQTNTIFIFTLEVGNDKVVKVSVQSKTKPDTENQSTLNNSMIININDSDVTYFTIKANTILSATDSVAVEQLTNQNSATINDFTPEYLTSIIVQIQNRLKELYNQKMQIASTVQQEENASQGLNQVDPNAPEANTITTNTLNTEL